MADFDGGGRRRRISDTSPSDEALVLSRAIYDGLGGESKCEPRDVVAMDAEEVAADAFLRVNGSRSLLDDVARLG